MTSSPVVHLHNHTTGSLLDGLSKIDDLVAAVTADGGPAVAVTDHGGMPQTWRLAAACQEAGIKPILGIEAYLAIGNRFDRGFMLVPKETDVDGADDEDAGTKKKTYEHLTMLAATPQGWNNLCWLGLQSEQPGSYWYKPRMDYALFGSTRANGRPAAEGIIVGSGCLGGPVAGPLARGDMQGAREGMARLVDIFGRDNVFAEVMDHGIDLERAVIPGIVQLAREFGLPVVATNDAHYVYPDDAYAQDVWLCIGQGGKKGRDKQPITMATPKGKRFSFNGTGYHVRTAAEMHALFDTQPGTEDAVSNTLLVADKVTANVLGEQRTRLPDYRPFIPGCCATSAQHLYHLTAEGAGRRYGLPLSDAVKARLRHEYDIILGKGVADYFLVVADIINWARSDRGLPSVAYPDGEPGVKRPILVGPGRGSGGGSATAYCLGITNLEPLSAGLLFERFLNPLRSDLPDFDTDFEARRRDEVTTYTQARFGSDRVARIGTWGLEWAKSSINDVGRATGQGQLASELSSKIVLSGPPAKSPMSYLLDPDEKLNSEFRRIVAANGQAAELVRVARTIEGVVRSEGIHPCGIVVGDEPLIGAIPLRCDRRKGRPGDEMVTSWDAHDIPKAGYVKIDLLAIKELDRIAAAVALIEADTGERVDVDNLPTESSNPRVAATWRMLAAGKTAMVFQLSGSGMTRLTQAMRPESLDDLSALVALYRPGPMGAGMPEHYTNRKHGLEPVDYGMYTNVPAEQDVLASVLGTTFGIIVYQEALQALAQAVADFTPADANRLRIAFSKKKDDEMDALHPIFVAGGMRSHRSDGQPKVAFRQDTLERLWQTFDASSEYLFNAAHSYAYGLVAYVTAYLKANWPAQFGAAVLSCLDTDKKGRAKRSSIIRAMRSEGITVLGPDVNVGKAATGVDPNGAVRIGLTEVAGAGDLAAFIESERSESGPYTSLSDLMVRVKIPGATPHQKKVLPVSVAEALIDAGACDSFGPRFGLRRIVRAAREAPDLPVPQQEWSILERSARERERLTAIVGEHPLTLLAEQVSQWREPIRGAKACPVSTLPRTDGAPVVTIGVVASAEMTPSRSGLMLRMTLDDPAGEVDVVMFGKTVARLGESFACPQVGQVVAVSGSVRIEQVRALPDDGDDGDDVDAVAEEVVTVVAWNLWDVDLASTPLESASDSEPESVPDLEPQPAPVIADRRTATLSLCGSSTPTLRVRLAAYRRLLTQRYPDLAAALTSTENHALNRWWMLHRHIPGARSVDDGLVVTSDVGAPDLVLEVASPGSGLDDVAVRSVLAG